jgi:hypothetical protein
MFNRRPKSLPIVMIGGLLAASIAPAAAEFRRDRGYNGLQQGYVIANSRFGNGSVKGAVRQAREGLQVQLPGGTWVYCRSTCSETLRVQTVDQFETGGRMIGYGTFELECGIFGCLSLGARWRD